MQFKGTVTSVSPVQSGTSKAGKQWSKIDVVLVYDISKPEYPKSIVFSVMNDNINKFNFQTGQEYEVEVDFSTREYNGKTYMSASCWRATLQQAAQQPQSPTPTLDSLGVSTSHPQPAAAPADDSDLPF